MCDLLDCKDCQNKCKDDLTDRELEKLWEELEDVTCIEAKDFYKDDEDYKDDISLVIMSDWQGFSAGTDTETIWHWFDQHHSKGVGWLMNEYEPED